MPTGVGVLPTRSKLRWVYFRESLNQDHDLKPLAVKLGYHGQFVLVCRICDRTCARGRRLPRRS